MDHISAEGFGLAADCQDCNSLSAIVTSVTDCLLQAEASKPAKATTQTIASIVHRKRFDILVSRATTTALSSALDDATYKDRPCARPREQRDC